MIKIQSVENEMLAQEIFSAAKWFFTNIGPNKNLDIVIKFGTFQDPCTLGDCFTTNGEFIITINRKFRRAYELYETLFHELWHVRQFVRRELWGDETGRLTFNGTDVAHIPYQDRPHEVEARKMASLILSEYLVVNA